jgi:hypothetical protein
MHCYEWWDFDRTQPMPIKLTDLIARVERPFAAPCWKFAGGRQVGRLQSAIGSRTSRN